MKKVIKIRSNIKSPNGQAWEYELGDYNLLIGPNESGKSAIAEAVQLALSGSAYGLFFRNAPVKAGNQLSDLGHVGPEGLFAVATFDDGTEARWSMEAVGKRPKMEGGSGEALPISELRSALSGSAQRARAFFLSRLLPEGVSRLELERLLNHPTFDLTKPLEVLIPDMGPRPITGETLVSALSEAGTWKRNAKSDAKAAQDLLTTLSTAEKADADQMHTAYENLFKSLKFEWLRKIVKEGSSDYDKPTLTNLALTLGTKEELKNLKGSAEYADDIEEMLIKQAAFRDAQGVSLRVKQHEKVAAEYDALIKGLDKACTTLLKAPLNKYIKRVNRFLPKGDKFGVSYSEKEFKIYLERGKQKHVALSGSTEIRLLAAMAAALPTGEESIMVILDDRMWDADTLSKTLDKLQSAPVQIVVMTTIPPAGPKKDAWRHIEISNEVRKNKAAEETIDLPSVQTTGGGSDGIPW